MTRMSLYSPGLSPQDWADEFRQDQLASLSSRTFTASLVLVQLQLVPLAQARSLGCVLQVRRQEKRRRNGPGRSWWSVFVWLRGRVWSCSSRLCFMAARINQYMYKTVLYSQLCEDTELFSLVSGTIPNFCSSCWTQFISSCHRIWRGKKINLKIYLT